MEDWCNKKWQTIDTPKTIYLECRFQACVGRMVISDYDLEAVSKRGLQEKYSEFLRLPMGVEWRNPLTSAVAYRIYGKQMKSGWPGDATTSGITWTPRTTSRGRRTS